MKLLMFAASLRQDSCNKKLIAISSKIAKEQGHAIDDANFSEFCATNYNADIQNNAGFPIEINTFAQRLKQSDGLIISSPEYNFSTPGTLKNLIDWVSRMNPVPWKDVPILLMSASPSLVGGNRGLWSTRIPLECCGSFVFPDMFSLASAYDAFDESNQLKDVNLFNRLSKTVTNFINFVEKIKA